MGERTISLVKPIDFHTADVVRILEEALRRAKAGEIRAVALAWETTDARSGHEAAFGDFSNCAAMVGRLHVLAQHITLNECLEWKPG